MEAKKFAYVPSTSSVEAGSEPDSIYDIAMTEISRAVDLRLSRKIQNMKSEHHTIGYQNLETLKSWIENAG